MGIVLNHSFQYNVHYDVTLQFDIIMYIVLKWMILQFHVVTLTRIEICS